MSLEKLKKEIKTCRDDPEYFISRWIKVVHPIRGLVPFELYPFQRKIVQEIQNHRFNILKKFRQAGCTTIAAALATHLTNFKSRQTVAVISKGDAESKEIIERARLMHDELPDFLKQKITRSNDHNLRFANGSVIKSRASSKDAGRSLASNLLVIDEAAFIEFIETIWAAAYPTISTGGRALILSTVNGIGNWFHDMYEQAKQKRNNFNVIDIDWEDHPEYKRHSGYEKLYEYMESLTPPLNVDDWEEINKNNMPPHQWRQEYLAQFLGTGETYLGADVLQRLKENPNNDYWIKYNNRMRIWENPHPAYEYCIGVDISLGRGKDYSAFHVINLYNGQQVAEFYSNKTPINELAEIVVQEGKLYNTAYVIPERNTIGNNLIDRIFNDLEYENVWVDTKQPKKREFGFQVTAKNRETILADLEEAIRMNKIKINSERLVDELLTFIITESGRVEADKGCNDDLIMSMALAVHCFNQIRGESPVEYEISDKFNAPLMPLKTKYLMKSYGGMTEEEYYTWLMSK